MSRSPQDVTDAELAVLEVLWDEGPCSRRRIADVLYPGGQPAHYTTVQKLLERLESKGLVARTRCLDDKRSFYVALTDEGEKTFDQVFPLVVEHGRQMFATYAESDFDALEQTLGKLKQLIADHSTCPTTQQQKEEF